MIDRWVIFLIGIVLMFILSMTSLGALFESMEQDTESEVHRRVAEKLASGRCVCEGPEQ